MTSFGWKRKIGDTVSKSTSKAFEDNSKDEDVSALESGEIDWLHLAPTKKFFSLEDAESKSLRLQKEGEVLAEAERFWEAINKWDGALQLTPQKATLHELKAQGYMQLNEPFPAVASAQKAVECDPTWYIGYVTKGRAQLNIGEVKLAITSFSRALHLNPTDREVWIEDFAWAVELINKQKTALEKEAEEQAKSSLTITELPDDSEASLTVAKWKVDPNFLLPVAGSSSASQEKDIKTLPKNMVKLRY